MHRVRTIYLLRPFFALALTDFSGSSRWMNGHCQRPVRLHHLVKDQTVTRGKGRHNVKSVHFAFTISSRFFFHTNVVWHLWHLLHARILLSVSVPCLLSPVHEQVCIRTSPSLRPFGKVPPRTGSVTPWESWDGAVSPRLSGWSDSKAIASFVVGSGIIIFGLLPAEMQCAAPRLGAAGLTPARAQGHAMNPPCPLITGVNVGSSQARQADTAVASRGIHKSDSRPR
jgi:hypothetical protein